MDPYNHRGIVPGGGTANPNALSSNPSSNPALDPASSTSLGAIGSNIGTNLSLNGASLNNLNSMNMAGAGPGPGPGAGASASATSAGASTVDTADLYRQFSQYRMENDQRIEQINIKTSFQLQLMNERLGAMETTVAGLRHDAAAATAARADPLPLAPGGSDVLQKKIELIGKHMADLSSDITKMNPDGSNNSTPSATSASANGAGADPGAGAGATAGPATGLDLNDPIEMKMDPMMRPLPNSNILDPLSNRPHPLAPGSSASSAQSIPQTVPPLQTVTQTVPPLQAVGLSVDLNVNTVGAGLSVQSVGPFSENLVDINKQWSRALGIRSPGIESPFTPKQLSFDYSIPINRALSFNNSTNQSNLAAANSANANAVSAIGASTPPVGLNPGLLIHPLLNQVVNSVDSIPSANSVNSATSANSINSVDSTDNGVASNIDDKNTSLLGMDLMGDITMDQDFKRRRKGSKSSESSKSPGSNASTNGVAGPGYKNIEAPQFKLEKGARNVSEIWKEYEYGINGKPPLKSLEIKYNARWRNDTESRTFVRRKKIYSAIETGKAKGYSEEEIINELENLRTYYSNGTVKKKPLSWLYTNIPQKFQ